MRFWLALCGIMFGLINKTLNALSHVTSSARRALKSRGIL
jgi:hypothetical protein